MKSEVKGNSKMLDDDVSLLTQRERDELIQEIIQDFKLTVGIPVNQEEFFIRKNQTKGKLWFQRRSEILKKMKHLKIQNKDVSVSTSRSYSDKKLNKARCYICFVRGHIYSDCPNKNRLHVFKRNQKQPVKGKIGKPSDRNKQGLFVDEKIVPEPSWKMLGSDQRGWDEIWYVSDKYPRHMTPTGEQFDKYKTANMSTIDNMKIMGYGEVLVTTESRVYVIPGVYHVPNMVFNTLSLSQLIAQGFKVKIKGSSCELLREFNDESDEDSREGSSVDDTKEILEQVNEKAMRATMRYFESLYDIKGKAKEADQVSTKNDYDSFVGFMDMINEQEIVMGCKDLVINHFEKLVEWFYGKFVHYKKACIPVKIQGKKVCLLDLYLTMKGMHGYEYVNTKKKWKDVATELGFQMLSAGDVKRYYEKYLGRLAYYKVAKEYSMDELAQALKACEGDGDGISIRSNSSE